MFKKTFLLTVTSFFIFIFSAEKVFSETVLAPNDTYLLKKTSTSKNKDNNFKPTFPIYTPPLRGAPSNRIGGGTRGTNETVKILSLTPDHTGITINNQPKLYFYLPALTNNPVEFILINENMEEPLIETNINVRTNGLQVIDISKYDIQLKEENTYQWYVSVKPNTEQSSLDIVSGGSIKFIHPSKLIKNTPKEPSKYTSFEYAKAGIWYETISSIIEENSSETSKENINFQISSLLNQAGINQNILK